MDAGGMDAPVPQDLLSLVDIFSPNETELARLTGMPTETFEQISQAAGECHKMGVKEVLVKLGSQGSALFVEGEKPIGQPIIPATEVIDTTGAGDTFTSAFAVALVEGKPKKECMTFACCCCLIVCSSEGCYTQHARQKISDEASGICASRIAAECMDRSRSAASPSAIMAFSSTRNSWDPWSVATPSRACSPQIMRVNLQTGTHFPVPPGVVNLLSKNQNKKRRRARAYGHTTVSVYTLQVS